MCQPEPGKPCRAARLLSSASGAFLVAWAANAENLGFSAPAAADGGADWDAWWMGFAKNAELESHVLHVLGTYGAFSAALGPQSESAALATESLYLDALSTSSEEARGESLVGPSQAATPVPPASRAFRQLGPGDRTGPRARRGFPGGTETRFAYAYVYHGTIEESRSWDARGSVSAVIWVTRYSLPSSPLVWLSIAEPEQVKALGTASYGLGTIASKGVGDNGARSSGGGAGTPEPSVGGLALLALGAAGLMRHRRRQAVVAADDTERG